MYYIGVEEGGARPILRTVYRPSGKVGKQSVISKDSTSYYYRENKHMCRTVPLLEGSSLCCVWLKSDWVPYCTILGLSSCTCTITTLEDVHCAASLQKGQATTWKSVTLCSSFYSPVRISHSVHLCSLSITGTNRWTHHGSCNRGVPLKKGYDVSLENLSQPKTVYSTVVVSCELFSSN